MGKRSKFCLIGIPDHEAVLALGGRLGAASGPRAFRRVWARFRPRLDIAGFFRDSGDVTGLGADVARNHRQAADAIVGLVRKDERAIVVGGSHDHGFSHLSGVVRSMGLKRPGLINLDAHLDVRKPAPRITSGSPFYLALESGILDPKRFVEFGIQSQCNAPELWDYASKKRLMIIGYDELRAPGAAVKRFAAALKTLAAHCDGVIVSLDLDCAAQAFAPGVSAPQAEGFSSSEVLEMMQLAGAHPKVASLGVFELNPLHDIDDRTARLAATAAMRFIGS